MASSRSAFADSNVFHRSSTRTRSTTSTAFSNFSGTWVCACNVGWKIRSLTFAFEAIEAYVATGRPLVVYALYDFDRSGADATRSLREKLTRFGDERGVDVHFNILGLTVEQVEDWSLPTRPHKRATVADQRWPHPYACELDAIPPHDLRALVKGAIEQHLPADELARLLNIEDLERETMMEFLSTWDVAL